MEFFDQHVLSFITFVPLVSALLVLASPSVGLARWVAMIGSLLALAGGLHVWAHFDGGSAGLQFAESYQWIPAFGIRYLMGVDGLSLLLVMLTVGLQPLILLSIWGADE